MAFLSPVKVTFWFVVKSGEPVIANLATSATRVLLPTAATPLPEPIAK